MCYRRFDTYHGIGSILRRLDGTIMSLANWKKMTPENYKLNVGKDPEKAFLNLLRTRGNVSTFWLKEVIPRILGKKKL